MPIKIASIPVFAIFAFLLPLIVVPTVLCTAAIWLVEYFSTQPSVSALTLTLQNSLSQGWLVGPLVLALLFSTVWSSITRRRAMAVNFYTILVATTALRLLGGLSMRLYTEVVVDAQSWQDETHASKAWCMCIFFKLLTAPALVAVYRMDSVSLGVT